MYTVGVAFRLAFSHTPTGRSKKKEQKTRSFHSFLPVLASHLYWSPITLIRAGLRAFCSFPMFLCSYVYLISSCPSISSIFFHDFFRDLPDKTLVSMETGNNFFPN